MPAVLSKPKRVSVEKLSKRFKDPLIEEFLDKFHQFFAHRLDWQSLELAADKLRVLNCAQGKARDRGFWLSIFKSVASFLQIKPAEEGNVKSLEELLLSQVDYLHGLKGGVRHDYLEAWEDLHGAAFNYLRTEVSANRLLVEINIPEAYLNIKYPAADECLIDTMRSIRLRACSILSGLRYMEGFVAQSEEINREKVESVLRYAQRLLVIVERKKIGDGLSLPDQEAIADCLNVKFCAVSAYPDYGDRWDILGEVIQYLLDSPRLPDYMESWLGYAWSYRGVDREVYIERLKAKVETFDNDYLKAAFYACLAKFWLENLESDVASVRNFEENQEIPVDVIISRQSSENEINLAVERALSFTRHLNNFIRLALLSRINYVLLSVSLLSNSIRQASFDAAENFYQGFAKYLSLFNEYDIAYELKLNWLNEFAFLLRKTEGVQAYYSCARDFFVLLLELADHVDKRDSEKVINEYHNTLLNMFDHVVDMRQYEEATALASVLLSSSRCVDKQRICLDLVGVFNEFFTKKVKNLSINNSYAHLVEPVAELIVDNISDGNFAGRKEFLNQISFLVLTSLRDLPFDRIDCTCLERYGLGREHSHRNNLRFVMKDISKFTPFAQKLSELKGALVESYELKRQRSQEIIDRKLSQYFNISVDNSGDKKYYSIELSNPRNFFCLSNNYNIAPEFFKRIWVNYLAYVKFAESGGAISFSPANDLLDNNVELDEEAMDKVLREVLEKLLAYSDSYRIERREKFKGFLYGLGEMSIDSSNRLKINVKFPCRFQALHFKKTEFLALINGFIKSEGFSLKMSAENKMSISDEKAFYRTNWDAFFNEIKAKLLEWSDEAKEEKNQKIINKFFQCYAIDTSGKDDTVFKLNRAAIAQYWDNKMVPVPDQITLENKAFHAWINKYFSSIFFIKDNELEVKPDIEAPVFDVELGLKDLIARSKECKQAKEGRKNLVKIRVEEWLRNLPKYEDARIILMNTHYSHILILSFRDFSFCLSELGEKYYGFEVDDRLKVTVKDSSQFEPQCFDTENDQYKLFLEQCYERSEEYKGMQVYEQLKNNERRVLFDALKAHNYFNAVLSKYGVVCSYDHQDGDFYFELPKSIQAVNKIALQLNVDLSFLDAEVDILQFFCEELTLTFCHRLAENLKFYKEFEWVFVNKVLNQVVFAYENFTQNFKGINFDSDRFELDLRRVFSIKIKHFNSARRRRVDSGSSDDSGVGSVASPGGEKGVDPVSDPELEEAVAPISSPQLKNDIPVGEYTISEDCLRFFLLKPNTVGQRDKLEKLAQFFEDLADFGELEKSIEAYCSGQLDPHAPLFVPS